MSRRRSDARTRPSARIRGAIGLLALLLAPVPAESGVRVAYEARLLPDQAMATIQIRVEQAGGELTGWGFDADPERFFGFEANGRLDVRNDRVAWQPPPDGGTLQYSVLVNHLRDPAEYDARCTSRWALFRGDDLFPISSWTMSDGGEPIADDVRLRVRMPAGWRLVSIHRDAGDGWLSIGDDGSTSRDGPTFLDTPRGWMMAGELDVAEDTIGETDVHIAGPLNDVTRVRDWLAFLRIALPHLDAAVATLPPRLIVVTADDPMWRGGLSGPLSMYLHADRPLLDRDGTSPLLHELMHVVTSASSAEDGDALVEGLAEYYSIALAHRAGLTSEDEFTRALDRMRERGRRAGSLRTRSASPEERARAVVLIADLDRWLRTEHALPDGLDPLLQRLAGDEMALGAATFIDLVEDATGIEVRGFLAARAPSLVTDESVEPGS